MRYGGYKPANGPADFGLAGYLKGLGGDLYRTGSQLVRIVVESGDVRVEADWR